VTHIYIKPSSNQCPLPHAKRPPHERLRPNALTGKVTPSTLTRLGSCPCESLFSDTTAGGEIAFTSHPGGRLEILRLPEIATAQAVLNDPVYQPLKALR
jgi:hypothetical protein